MVEEDDDLGMDYILTYLIGSEGRAQWKIVLFAFVADIAGGIPLLLHMFTAYAPDHRCAVPICEEGLNSTYNVTWKGIAFPKNSRSSNFLKTEKLYDSCASFKVIDHDGGCEESNFNVSLTESCQSWVYDQSDFPYTLSTEHDLVCGSEAKRRLLSTFMMLGLMIGSLLGGKLGDWIGRKKTCFIPIAILIPTIALGGYSPNYEIYAALRLITCTCLPCIWVSIHSLTFELFGMKGREKFLACKDLFYPMYVLILGGLSFFLRKYEELHLVCGALCFLSLLMYFFIPESVRWEAENNRIDRAKATLMRLARENGKKLKSEDEDKIDKILHHIHDKIQKSEGKGKLQIWDMFRKSQMKVTLILLLNWISINVGSYTLTLEATKLSGNIWMNFILSALIEIPGSVVIFFFLSVMGRRYNLFMYQMIVAASCFTLAFIPKTWNIAVLAVYLTGKIAVGAGFLLVWILPVELYPTNLRAQALGTLSTIARLFGISSSFIATLAKIWKPFPLLIIGIPCLIAGILALLLPETSNKELPDTLLNTTSSKKSKKVKSEEEIGSP